MGGAQGYATSSAKQQLSTHGQKNIIISTQINAMVGIIMRINTKNADSLARKNNISHNVRQT